MTTCSIPTRPASSTTRATITRNRRRGCGRCLTRWRRRNSPRSSAARRRKRRSTISPGSIRRASSRRLLAAVPAAGHAGDRRRYHAVAGSGEAALRAAGAVVAAVDAVVAGEADNAFCAVRPPGHHAEPGAGDGVLPVQQRRDRGAAGARRRTASPASRSIDFDVHHGNGTQASFGDDAEPLLCLDAPVAALSRHRRARRDRASATSSTCRCAPMSGSAEFRLGMSAT